MSFDRFLLAVESRDLYQADKSLILSVFFSKMVSFLAVIKEDSKGLTQDSLRWSTCFWQVSHMIYLKLRKKKNVC